MPVCTVCSKERLPYDFRYVNCREGFERNRERLEYATVHVESAWMCKQCVHCRESKYRSQRISKSDGAVRREECATLYKMLREESLCVDCGHGDGIMLKKRDMTDPVTPLSVIGHWATASRGVEAMKMATDKFFPCCRYCAGIRGATIETDFDEWLRDKFVSDGKACDCHRVLNNDTYGGFQFAHIDSRDKTLSMYELREAVRSGRMTTADAKKAVDSEWHKGRILCANCHEQETMSRTKQNESLRRNLQENERRMFSPCR